MYVCGRVWYSFLLISKVENYTGQDNIYAAWEEKYTRISEKRRRENSEYVVRYKGIGHFHGNGMTFVHTFWTYTCLHSKSMTF